MARWPCAGSAALACALMTGWAGLAAAQGQPEPKVQASAKAKIGSKAKAQARAVDSRTELRSQASQMAAGVQAAEAALGPDELAIAEQVHTGTLPCELGASVSLVQDPQAPGYFDLRGKNFKFRLLPVLSQTGAIRLEDRRAGAVWLQLANKSMLMNHKAGRRMADDCMSPAQELHAQALKDSPPTSLLEAPP